MVRQGSGVRSFPVLTAVAVGIAMAAAALQYAVPAVVALLARDPVALRSGQWWRLVTPLLVQTLGWYQVVANLVTLAAVGTVAECLLGRRRWAVLLAAGTAGGQLAAHAWQEPGGGSSIAVCGLAGGVGVALLTGPGSVPRWPSAVVVLYVAALTGWAIRGSVGAVLAAAVAVLGLVVVRRVERTALTVALLCGVGLVLARELHGAALTAGALAGALLLPRHRSPAAGATSGAS